MYGMFSYMKTKKYQTVPFRIGLYVRDFPRSSSHRDDIPNKRWAQEDQSQKGVQ